MAYRDPRLDRHIDQSDQYHRERYARMHERMAIEARSKRRFSLAKQDLPADALSMLTGTPPCTWSSGDFVFSQEIGRGFLFDDRLDRWVPK